MGIGKRYLNVITDGFLSENYSYNSTPLSHLSIQSENPMWCTYNSEISQNRSVLCTNLATYSDNLVQNLNLLTGQAPCLPISTQDAQPVDLKSQSPYPYSVSHTSYDVQPNYVIAGPVMSCTVDRSHTLTKMKSSCTLTSQNYDYQYVGAPEKEADESALRGQEIPIVLEVRAEYAGNFFQVLKVETPYLDPIMFWGVGFPTVSTFDAKK